jgi:hypothetical protein
MNKLNLHNVLILFTGLLTGVTVILYENWSSWLKQAPNASAMVAPSPTLTPASYDPILYISFREGAPGSIFTFTGEGYHDIPNNPVTIWVNGRKIGTMDGSLGWFVFMLDTANADEGLYVVHVRTPGLEKTEFFRLDASLLVCQPKNIGTKFMIPAEIGFTRQKFLPVVMRKMMDH